MMTGEPQYLADLSPSDVRAYLVDDDRIIVPFGSTENNGPHLPLGTDAFAARAVAETAAGITGVLLAPTIPWGASSVNMGFPGTITLQPNVLERVIEEICTTLAFHGFRRFAMVSGHYGNVWPVASAAETLRDRGLLVAQVDLWRSIERFCRELVHTEQMPFGHGGEMMTSVVLASNPELVARERMETEIPPEGYGLKYYRSYPEVMGFAAWDDVSTSGSVGDPTHASAEAGQEAIRRIAMKLAELLEDMKAAQLPQQRGFL